MEEKVKKIIALVKEYREKEDDHHYQDIEYLLEDLERILEID